MFIFKHSKTTLNQLKSPLQVKHTSRDQTFRKIETLLVLLPRNKFALSCQVSIKRDNFCCYFCFPLVNKHFLPLNECFFISHEIMGNPFD